MQISKISASYVQKTNNNSKSNSNPLSNNYQTSRSEVISKAVSITPATVNFSGAFKSGSLLSKALKFNNEFTASQDMVEGFLEKAKRIQKLTEQMKTNMLEILINSGDMEKTKLINKDKCLYYSITTKDNGTEVNFHTTFEDPDGDSGSYKDFFFKKSNKGELDCYRESTKKKGESEVSGESWYKFISDSDFNVLTYNDKQPTTVIKIRNGKITENPISGSYSDLFDEYIKPLEEVEI